MTNKIETEAIKLATEKWTDENDIDITMVNHQRYSDFIAGANYAMKEGAIAFGNFLAINDWRECGFIDGQWLWKSAYHGDTITTSELYAKFQSEKGA